MKIRLSGSEIMIGANVGVMRQVQNIVKKRKTNYGRPAGSADFETHILAACAELAVARFMGIYWNGKIGDLSPGDVGYLEVRHTTRPSGRLIVHETDRDDRYFVLVRGILPVLDVVGWIRGEYAKIPKFWHDPGNGRPAYFVPADALDLL